MPRKTGHSRQRRQFDFDVCLSFAGEDRRYVRQVAASLRKRGVRVFFDEYARAELWGKDLYTHLDDVYQNSARYCVIFISRYYADRVWTNHERASAQARAFRENSEYILPARFDSTEVPGLRPTIGYVDLSQTSPDQLSVLIEGKLGNEPRVKFFPPIPDKLYKRLKARSAKAKHKIESRARDFFNVLTRMSPDEREVIFQLFIYGCPTELPENVHINIDLLRRVSSFTPAKIMRLLAGLQSLGFRVEVREDHDHGSVGGCGVSRFVVIEWHDMSTDEIVGGNATAEADAAIFVGIDGLCDECALESLYRLDFSQLASPTSSMDSHGGLDDAIQPVAS